MRWKLIVGIIFLVLSFTAGQVMADELPSSSQTSKPQEAKYPPYPDVWDWHKPSTTGYPFSMYKLQDGDILIKYTKQYSGKDEKLEVYAVTFFGRKVFVGEDARLLIKRAEEEKRGGLDLKAKRIIPTGYLKAASPDGTWNIADSAFPAGLYCYEGPNRNPYTITNRKTGHKRIFTIFRLLEKPEKFFIDGRYLHLQGDEVKEFPDARCQSSWRRTVTYKVKSISGEFFFLEDNSFLFQVEETGEVLRFDSDLKSKSSLVSDRFFLIENNGGTSIMHILTGKVYEDDVDPIVETEDLYNYLITIKKKGRK